MGLAPYGEPRYVDLIMEKLIHVADDGSFKLDMQYFEYATGLTMTNSKFDKLFGGPPRMPRRICRSAIWIWQRQSRRFSRSLSSRWPKISEEKPARKICALPVASH